MNERERQEAGNRVLATASAGALFAGVGILGGTDSPLTWVCFLVSLACIGIVGSVEIRHRERERREHLWP